VIDCFYDLGYAGTTTEQVARRAGVSRGAMLHHFPSRFDLIRNAVAHLSEKRLALFEREEMRIQANAEHTRVAEGIDSYWRQLKSKLFVVFHELQVAARTDPELKKIVIPAIAEFDERWLDMSERVFPDLSQSKNFLLINFLTLFLLEGMAVNEFTRRPGKWTDILLRPEAASRRGVLRGCRRRAPPHGEAAPARQEDVTLPPPNGVRFLSRRPPGSR
jgi:AcrR family transcriptional regulator